MPKFFNCAKTILGLRTTLRTNKTFVRTIKRSLSDSLIELSTFKLKTNNSDIISW